MSIRHRFVSPIPDGPDATQVRPSNWNDEHVADVATDSTPGVVQLAPDGDVTPGRAVQASDSRLLGSALPAALEMELAFKAAHLENHKVLTWAAGRLTAFDVWETPAMLVKLFHKDFTYDVDGVLTQVVLTRISDGGMLTRDLLYDVDGNLVSMTAS